MEGFPSQVEKFVWESMLSCSSSASSRSGSEGQFHSNEGSESSQNCERNLMDIPEEVFHSAILPKLQFNDLLRLRVTSKQLSNYVNGYIRSPSNFCDHYVRISEFSGTSFSDFILRDIPCTHIHLFCRVPQLFEDPHMPEFIQKYGSMITHLRVRRFFTCVTEEEGEFYSALDNLQHLDIEEINARGRDSDWPVREKMAEWEEKEFVRNDDSIWFPPNFKNLKSLKLNGIEETKGGGGYFWDLIGFCTKLEYLEHPRFVVEEDKEEYDESILIDDHCEFKRVIAYLTRRQLEFPDEPNLKYLDLERYYSNRDSNENIVESSELWNLLEVCVPLGVKLMNVVAETYKEEHVSRLMLKYPEEIFAGVFLSMVNLSDAVVRTELPNLEKLVIESTYWSSFDRDMAEIVAPQWPKLKVLDIEIDADFYPPDDFEEDLADLMTFLFVSVERENLKELAIRFDTNWDGVPGPRVQDVVTSCGNVTKLTLSNWQGSNQAISKLWGGLAKLEHVTFEKCRQLSYIAFVGKDRGNPTFLQLTKLKKVRLVGLSDMPKMTDMVFRKIFRHLKVKEFSLESGDIIQSVTADGIRSLLTGEFKDHVERFTLVGPHFGRILDIPGKEFSELGRTFRFPIISYTDFKFL